MATPLVKSSAGVGTGPGLQAAVSKMSLRSSGILFVDDDEAFSYAAAKELRAAGYEVWLAPDHRLALQIPESPQFADRDLPTEQKAGPGDRAAQISAPRIRARRQFGHPPRRCRESHRRGCLKCDGDNFALRSSGSPYVDSQRLKLQFAVPDMAINRYHRWPIAGRGEHQGGAERTERVRSWQSRVG
jgi:CheY-like chemotaxis protein